MGNYVYLKFYDIKLLKQAGIWELVREYFVWRQEAELLGRELLVQDYNDMMWGGDDDDFHPEVRELALKQFPDFDDLLEQCKVGELDVDVRL